MKSETGDPYGTSISVVSRIINVLKIESGKHTTPDLHIIVSLNDILRARMRKLSISDEEAKPTGIEIGLMLA